MKKYCESAYRYLAAFEGEDGKISYRLENKEDDANYALIKKEEYSQLRETILNLESKIEELQIEMEEPDIPNGYVIITEEEKYGYEHALDIIHDRSLQQIDKSKADKYGYTLYGSKSKEIGFGPYDKNTRFYPISVKIWQIRKATPYSIKMPLESVEMLIERDLEKNYAPLVDLRSECIRLPIFEIFKEKMDNPYLLNLMIGIFCEIKSNKNRFSNENIRTEWYRNKVNVILSNVKNPTIYIEITRDEMVDYMKFVDSINDNFIFDIEQIEANYKDGIYVVTYRAMHLC